MDLLSYIGNPRITDYSFKVADAIFLDRNSFKKDDMILLFNYHLNLCEGPNALYPQSNWQSHRICLMSAIAVALNDTKSITRCDHLIDDWITRSNCNCCDACSHDFHWRDSCEYVIYG